MHYFCMYRVHESNLWVLEVNGEYDFGFMAPRNKLLKFIRNFIGTNGR